jgi:penicillin-binding protein 1A
MAQKSQKTGVSKFTQWIWRLFLGGMIFLFLLFFLAALDVFGKLPTFEELENPENNLATEVISIDGKTLGKYYRENRTPVKFRELPENLIQALISTEDERFYEHSGIDFQGTARAAAKFGKDGGASTITQQLAKMLFTKKASGNIAKRLIQKVKEWVIAIRLEKHYTKNEIITMYFNKYDFGHAAVGIRSASRIYFGKEPKELNIEESAMLVGMLKNSSLYNPMRRSEMVTQRRNVVFGQMLRNEFITEHEKDSLQNLPLELDINLEGHSDGTATYFREYVREFMRKWMKEHPKPNGESYNIYRDGLKIYVTLDSRLQKNAEEAMAEHLTNLQSIFFKQQKKNKTAPFYDLEKEQIESTMLSSMKRSERWRKMKENGAAEKDIKASFYVETPMKLFSWKGEIDTVLTPYDSIRYNKFILQSGLLSTDPTTGHVKAWVGGIDYKYFQYDHVKQGKRQVGSTFKPFVYATAINQLGLSPCDEFPNTPYTIPAGKYHLNEDWTPRNSGDEYGGLRSLKNALANSINVISANLIDQTTPQNVVRMAKNLGVETEIPEVPSVALGTVDLSLYEMVGALNTFANKGMYVKPMMILRIEDKNGTILEEFTPETKEVLSESIAYTTINLMEGVTRYGSGIRLRTTGGKYPDNVATGYPYKFDNPIAGKTGTTQNQSDGWFIGLVPNLSTGIWVGAEDRSVHFVDITRGQGASMALPIWALYMKRNYADEDLEISKEDFEKPENLTINVDCDQERDADDKEKDPKKPDPNDEIDF